MQKLICLFILSAIFTLACSSPESKEYDRAEREWIKANPDALAKQKTQMRVLEYFTNFVRNDTCADAIEDQISDISEKALAEWIADNSRLGDILSNLLDAAYPSIIVQFKNCNDRDKFSKHEKNFNSSNASAMVSFPYLRAAHNKFTEELAYFTKGELKVNETCMKNIPNLIEMSRLAEIAGLAEGQNINTRLAKGVYFEESMFIRMAQRCVNTGQYVTIFNHYLEKNPGQNALYVEQYNRFIGISAHIRSSCSNEVSEKWGNTLRAYVSKFESGKLTIGEIINRLSTVDLPELTNVVSKCLAAEGDWERF